MFTTEKDRVCLRVILVSILLFSVLSASSQALAGTKLYTASWISESFGNDLAGIGTGASQYFSIYPIPWGHEANPKNPLCNFQSTPVTTAGAGTMFNPLGPECTLLPFFGTTRPPKHGTLTPLGGTCPGAPASPCSKTAPLYRNPAFFTAGGQAYHTNVDAYFTVGGSPATMYLSVADPLRGIGMKAAPLEGGGSATTSSGTAPGRFSFNFPAANPPPATDGFRRTTVGSFSGLFPYLYSYTYADLRNDAGNFGVGQGFFSTGASTNGGAPRTMVTYTLKVGGGPVQTATVTKGVNTFGGVMKLLGSYTTKVCYFYQGGCGLGYGTWQYELIGAAGVKNVADKNHPKASSVVTAPFTTQKSFMYFNTAIKTIATYTNLAERWPWTTGIVTVRATGRGAFDTVVRRVGFDNRDTAGVGTVQLVSPVITQWIGSTPAAMLETGGVAVMQIRFVPEPGVAASLICFFSLLVVLKRYRS